LEVLSILVSQVRLIDYSFISVGSWIEARRLTRGIDMDDITFVALALELNASL
jgi:predicted nucleic acid-binding protein